MKYLKTNSPIHTIVHLGSGHCSEMPEYQQLQPEKILLIEGDEEVAESLQQQFGKNETIKIINALVGTNSEQLPFFRFSLSDVNSLCEPQALYEHFPGIRLASEQPLAVQDVSELMVSMNLVQDQNLLVVDLPGNSLEVLQYLQTRQQLEVFSQISLYLNQQPLYVNEATVDQALSWLNQQGYELREIENQQDIERPCYQLLRSPFFLKYKKLEAEFKQANSQHQQALKEAQAKAAALQTEFNRLKEEKENASTDFNTLKQQAEAAQAQVAQLKKNLVQKNTALEEATQSQAKFAEDLKHANSQHQQALKEAQAKTSALQTEFNRLKEEKENASTDFNALKQQAEAAQAQVAQLKKNLVQKNTALEEATQSQAKLAEDLKHANSQHQQTLAESEDKVISLESVLEKNKLQHQQALKDVQAKTAALQTELNALKEEKEKYQTYFANRKKQAEDSDLKNKELTEALKTLEIAKQATEKQLAAEIQAKDALRADLTGTMQALSQAQQTIEQLQNTGNQLQQLEQKMADLLSAQGQKMQEYTNALGQHVTRSAKHTTQHLEAFLGVQKYLVQDGIPLQLNGSRIPADLALKITERLQHTHYDLIIEFGCGTSTLLLAKALLKQEQGKTQSQHLITRESSHTHIPDLPKHIISFEHNKEALKTLVEQLDQQGLDSLIETVFAPLTEVMHKGDEYLFYDCKAKLRQLAHMLEGREARALILVDGPDTPDGNQSRYPALPTLLKYLGAHQLDFLVPQPEVSLPFEQQHQWEAILQKRCLTYKKTSLITEKGCLLLQVNI